MKLAWLATGVLAVGVIAGGLWLPGYLDRKGFEQAVKTEQGAGQNLEAAVAAYREYLAKRPRGRYTQQARYKVEKELPGRIDDREWHKCEAESSIAACESYLARFPRGKWVGQARKELAVLKRAQAEFAKGRELYIYDPSPATLSKSSADYAECTVKYVRRSDAPVSGDLVAVTVFRDGRYALPLPLDLMAGGSGSVIGKRRGELQISLYDLREADHFELFVIQPGGSRGGTLEVISNKLVIAVR
ncbi:MAG: hypothetical protein N2512_02545 [Armatimonadetes bacterium]|nr:hypothetical protein [Armatimonadota bacterium]